EKNSQVFPIFDSTLLKTGKSLEEEIGKQHEEFFEVHLLAIHIHGVVAVHDRDYRPVSVAAHDAVTFKIIHVLIEQHARQHLELLLLFGVAARLRKGLQEHGA